MTLKIGIVGCGKIADAHVEEIQKLDIARVIAVCDLEPIMAEQLAVRYGVPKHYSDIDQMLSEEQFDVIHITTPPQSHLSLAKKAVEAGCHIYMEKPLASTSTEAISLIDAVNNAGRKLTVNYWPNFDPPGLMLRELTSSGILGEPVHVESYLGYNLSGAYGQALLSDPAHWVHKLPGKLFQNNLDHIINKITPFLPEERLEIIALAYRRRDRLKNDITDAVLDELRVIIRAGRVSAYATMCSHARPAAHFVRVYGTKNTVYADFNLRTVMLEADQKVPSALGRILPPFQQALAYFRQGRRNASAFARSKFHYFAGMNQLISLFYESILNNGPVPIPYSEMIRVSTIMDEIISQVYDASTT